MSVWRRVRKRVSSKKMLKVLVNNHLIQFIRNFCCTSFPIEYDTAKAKKNLTWTISQRIGQQARDDRVTKLFAVFCFSGKQFSFVDLLEWRPKLWALRQLVNQQLVDRQLVPNRFKMFNSSPDKPSTTTSPCQLITNN